MSTKGEERHEASSEESGSDFSKAPGPSEMPGGGSSLVTSAGTAHVEVEFNPRTLQQYQITEPEMEALTRQGRRTTVFFGLFTLSGGALITAGVAIITALASGNLKPVPAAILGTLAACSAVSGAGFFYFFYASWADIEEQKEKITDSTETAPESNQPTADGGDSD